MEEDGIALESVLEEDDARETENLSPVEERSVENTNDEERIAVPFTEENEVQKEVVVVVEERVVEEEMELLVAGGSG